MTPLDLAELIRATRRVDCISATGSAAMVARELHLLGQLAITPALTSGDALAKLRVLEELIRAKDQIAHQLALVMSLRADLAVIFDAAHVASTATRDFHNGTVEQAHGRLGRGRGRYRWLDTFRAASGEPDGQDRGQARRAAGSDEADWTEA